jgi:hypothetical protein
MKQHTKEKSPGDHKKQSPKADDKKNKKQPSHIVEEQKGLTKEDLPDSTNESTGQMGSGLRQDSN